MIVLVQDYSCTGPRREELDLAMRRNLENPLVEKVVSLGEKGFVSFEHSKLVVIRQNERATFEDFFKVAMGLESDKMVAIMNTDCYIGEGWEGLQLTHSQAVCLTRWEQGDPPAVHPYIDPETSHDCWVFRTPLRDIQQADIYLGTLGCDGGIAKSLENAGYSLLNPLWQVQLVHVDMVSNKNPLARKPGGRQFKNGHPKKNGHAKVGHTPLEGLPFLAEPTPRKRVSKDFLRYLHLRSAGVIRP